MKWGIKRRALAHGWKGSKDNDDGEAEPKRLEDGDKTIYLLEKLQVFKDRLELEKTGCKKRGQTVLI